jgi:ABC-2 type transport system ATP-binding protein
MTNEVELLDIYKSFKTKHGEVHAVEGLSLEIPVGQTVALLGPNGAGKTTTIDMMLGLTTPDRGRVLINGENPHLAIRRGRIGAMLQNGGLITELTVREMISMTASLYPKPMSVDRALALSHMTERADQRAGKLSGGETQRVRFAVAIVSSPTLLVLDEPTVAMDVQGREDFWATVTGLEREGVTCLFASHYLDEADLYADRVVVISRGRLLADGTPAEIKALAGGRKITASTSSSAGAQEYERLPGVTAANIENGSLELRCSDSDTALRALLDFDPAVEHIEVMPVPLEEAFLTITAKDSKEVAA